MSEKKTALEQAIVLRPGDEKLEVSMGFVARGTVRDFERIRSFIENETHVRLVKGTMSQSRLWLVKDTQFKILQDTLREGEKRGA